MLFVFTLFVFTEWFAQLSQRAAATTALPRCAAETMISYGNIMPLNINT
tara:strand:- start:539 stop:685 length:147 start_codon:yes stop_codon:yes gene_type:complete